MRRPATTSVRRAVATALALLALALQSLAPVAVAPPQGQPVHFAHAHHAGHEDHAGGHAHAGHAPESPDEACPVCKALAAAGVGISAPVVALAVVFALEAPRGVLHDAPAPRPVARSAHRARAPPSPGA